MSEKPILYLGDTSLCSAAGYLAGLMSLWKYGYEYLPSHTEVNGEVERPRSLYIVSDYPARMMSERAQVEIARRVEQGAGLLMIGGWESFHGLGGDWDDTTLAKVLPVSIEHADDRVNCDQPAVVRRLHDHPIVDGLPWDERPPVIGGFNRFTAKGGADVLLEVQRFSARRQGDDFLFRPTDRHPVLVVGRYGKGRTAALATDLAPHWIGGMVDWGTSRVTAEAPASWAIEVGDHYAGFIRRLLTWTGQLDRTLSVTTTAAAVVAGKSLQPTAT